MEIIRDYISCTHCGTEGVYLHTVHIHIMGLTSALVCHECEPKEIDIMMKKSGLTNTGWFKSHTKVLHHYTDGVCLCGNIWWKEEYWEQKPYHRNKHHGKWCITCTKIKEK